MSPRKPATTPLTIALVGGTGFVGRAVAQALVAQGHTVRLVARHQPAQFPVGATFQAADATRPAPLKTALEGADVVVHLVATLAERGQPFTTTIQASAANTAQAAKTAGASHMVLVSALGASANSPSRYARAKAAAEHAVRQSFPQATILQPSLVMGDGGGFRQQVEKLTRYAPCMVLPGGGISRFQPVELDILAQTIAAACTQTPWRGRTAAVAGPQVVTFRQLVVQELARLGRHRLLLPLPWWVTRLVAAGMAWADHLTRHRLIPQWLLVTPDQVTLLRQDNILPPPYNSNC